MIPTYVQKFEVIIQHYLRNQSKHIWYQIIKNVKQTKLVAFPTKQEQDLILNNLLSNLMYVGSI